MNTIEVVGNRWLLFLLFILGITIPFAILYLLEATVTVETEIDNPEEFMDSLRKRKIS